MLWFLLELKTTFLVETSMKKTQFYLHFGAGFLVWFVYLPLVAFVCAWLSALNRYKTITCEFIYVTSSVFNLLMLIGDHMSGLWLTRYTAVLYVLLYVPMLCVSMLGVSYSADFLSLCVLVHLLWPTRSYFYFNLDRLETRAHDLGDLGLAYSGTTMSVCLSVSVSLSDLYISFSDRLNLQQLMTLTLHAQAQLSVCPVSVCLCDLYISVSDRLETTA